MIPRLQLSALSLTIALCVCVTAQAQKNASATKPAFETPLMTAKTQPRILEVDAPIKGAKELYLVVSDEGSPSCDWSDWLEPKLIMADGTTKDLTTLKWKSAKSGSGKVNVGKNAMGGPLIVDKKEYANGIGTHAASTIVFDLPAGVERFTAKVAIDDGGMIRKGKPSDASVRFHIYTQKPSFMVGVQSADCLPLLLASEKRTSVMAVHAGWKGLTSGVIGVGVGAGSGAGFVTGRG